MYFWLKVSIAPRLTKMFHRDLIVMIFDLLPCKTQCDIKSQEAIIRELKKEIDAYIASIGGLNIEKEQAASVLLHDMNSK